jgi:hypothetical protein
MAANVDVYFGHPGSHGSEAQKKIKIDGLSSKSQSKAIRTAMGMQSDISSPQA